ncbi:unnamed protein product [Miscanthus lutarioriparius]|uniref:Uncharacterized protein n=1 Tax=Miscanthus lutarioriparius TaxID=422564 RepID=A0A811QTZ1_9POAL|nr:unnamed protein product [Miscanthus lutarioriparius]
MYMGGDEDAHAGKGPDSSAKRIRLELVDKMPDNPKRLVFESTQQRYASHSPSKNPAVAPTSRDHSQRRTHAAQRIMDRVPSNLKRVVFESSQERFEHHIRPGHVLPTAAGHDSDDDDFMPIPNARSFSHIDKSKDVGPRKTRQTRAGLSTGACTEGQVACSFKVPVTDVVKGPPQVVDYNTKEAHGNTAVELETTMVRQRPVL